MELDSIFYKYGVRFYPTQGRVSSKNSYYYMPNLDKSVRKTQYWKESFWKSLSDGRVSAITFMPVRTLIKIRRYIAYKNCGAYEKAIQL